MLYLVKISADFTILIVCNSVLFNLSDEGVLTADNTDDSNHDGDHKLGNPLREQDRFLPIANVAKIMKKAIPENGKVRLYIFRVRFCKLIIFQVLIL